MPGGTPTTDGLGVYPRFVRLVRRRTGRPPNLTTMTTKPTNVRIGGMTLHVTTTAIAVRWRSRHRTV